MDYRHLWLTRCMKITKLHHAALLLENAGAKLLIDPGSWTPALPDADLAGLVGVVLTHEHADHWSAEHLEQVRAVAPDAVVLAPAALAPLVGHLTGESLRVVAPGEQVQLATFALRFTGGWHAAIHHTIPLVHNVGVVVNEAFYYPGDSFDPAGAQVAALAVPVGGPWLKLGEAMDFILAAAPAHAFATHDLPLSETGLAISRPRLRAVTEQAGGVFYDLDPGHSIEI